MSAEASTLLLEHHLKVLKLPTFVRDYKSVAAVCAQERCDYPTYLLRLAERELIDRERRAAERRIRDARFPVIKTIDTFDFKAQPSINQALVRELIASGEYMSKRENVLLVGNPGTGKTHLALALGFAACAHGKKVRFTTTTAMVILRSSFEHLREAFAPRLLPVGDLCRVHFELLGDLLGGLDPFERLKGYSGFECGIVSSAFGFHLGGFQVWIFSPQRHLSIA
jgi:DNA replication protein DnaC